MIPISFVMGAVSFVLELVIAIPLGVIAATKQYSRADYAITALSLVGISLPTFLCHPVEAGLLGVAGVV